MAMVGSSMQSTSPMVLSTFIWFVQADLHSRPLPSWYDEAQIGIFMGVGPYAVPGELIFDGLTLNLSLCYKVD